MDRPLIAVGHLRLHCADVSKSKEFYEALGMRNIDCQWENLAILELRGGTHLLLVKSPDEMMELLDQPFDLMVDDLDDFRTRLLERGFAASEVSFHGIADHRRFTVADPDGRRVAIHSSHTAGRSV